MNPRAHPETRFVSTDGGATGQRPAGGRPRPAAHLGTRPHPGTSPRQHATPGDAVQPTLLLTLDEVAEQLRCTRRGVERLVAARGLVSVHIGRAVRIESRELERFVADLRAPTLLASESGPPNGGPGG